MCGASAFYGISLWDCTLHVPSGCLDAYKAAPQWKDFIFIVDDAVAGVESIEADNDEMPVSRYYDMRGIEVTNPQGGLFIEVRGAQHRKVAIP